MNAFSFAMWAHMLAVKLEFEALIRRERGQTLAEYSLLITVIAVAVVVTSMVVMRGALAGAFSAATACIARTTC